MQPHIILFLPSLLPVGTRFTASFPLICVHGEGDMTKRKLIGLFPTEEMKPDLLSWQTEEKPHLQPHG